MFQNLRIKNLRLFGDLEIGKLKRINLLAGRNNSGKTTVLEAIFLLAGIGDPKSMLVIKEIRGISQLRGTVPRTYRESLFSNLDTQQPIEISGKHTQLGEMVLLISQELRDTIKLQNSKDFAPLRAEQGTIDSSRGARLHVSEEELVDPWSLRLSWTKAGRSNQGRMRLTDQGYEISYKKLDSPFQAVFLSSSVGDVHDDARRLGQLRTRKQGDLLTKALQIVEPRLKSVEEISVGGLPMIWGDIGLPELTPLSAMGEGMTRVARIVLAISSARGGFVLLDEIETGIHHSTMSDVWAVVAEAAHQFDVQVFATTHSFECLVAAHEALGEALRFHRLDRVKDGSNSCVTFDTEDVEAVVRHGMEVR